MINSIINNKVIVYMSDPWDFVSKNGEQRVGTIIDIIMASSDSPCLAIKLSGSIRYNNMETDKIYARFRHTNANQEELLSGKIVPCNFSSDLENRLAQSVAISFIGALQLSRNE